MFVYRADGGVCNNDFLMQLMADMTHQHIDRAKQRGDMTSLGTAFLAGLAKGRNHLSVIYPLYHLTSLSDIFRITN